MRAQLPALIALLVSRFFADAFAPPPGCDLAQAGMRCLRRLALALTLTLAWSFALAPVAEAAASPSQPDPHTARPLTRPVSVWESARLLHQAEARQARDRAVPTLDLAAAAHFRPRLRPRQRPSVSLLDEVGLLARPLPAAQVAAWKQELTRGRPTAARAATLHLWLGEWELAHAQQPRAARWHFRQAQLRLSPRDPRYGLGAYDRAIALYYGGAYSDAADAFHHLVTRRGRLPGYDLGTAVLWWRHAAACTGFHAQREAQGIPEPRQLDPLCGAASLAAALRGLHRPFDRRTLLSACRVTGEGSTLADLLASGRRLGVHVRAVTADEAGLVALPKPVVAYVEHDHFVAVIKADTHGVSYLCSDCGPWPGGEVDLSWRQWRLLEATAYAVVTVPGSAWDKALSVALAAPPPSELPPPGCLLGCASPVPI